LRVVDITVPLRLEVPDLRLVVPGCFHSTSATRYAALRSVILEAQWSEVAALANQNGLRAAARRFNVSHETIRRIVLKVNARA
jgi:hypothetical protein